MTVTKTYLLYIVILLLCDLLLRKSKQKPDSTRILLQGHNGNSRNVKSKIVLTTEERRQHLRTGVVWPIAIKNSHKVIRAGIKDISLEGGFVVCEKPLPLKEQFRLAIDIPNQKPLALAAEVVWSNSNVPEDRVINRGMGIKFLQHTENVRESLNKAIRLYQEQGV